MAISDEEKLDSEEPARMSNLCRSSDICLTEQRAYTPFNDESGQLICNEHSGKLEREDVLKGTAGNFLFQLKGERSVLLKYVDVQLPHNALSSHSIM